MPQHKEDLQGHSGAPLTSLLFPFQESPVLVLWQSECTLSFKTCLNSSEKPSKTTTLPLLGFPLSSELPSQWWQTTSTHLSFGIAKRFSCVLPLNTKLLHRERSVSYSERSTQSETHNFVIPMPGECSGDVVQSVNT